MVIAVIAAMQEELARVNQRDDRLRPMVCGVGKVHAALALQRAARDCGPVIVIGTAGAADPTLNVGDIVISTDAVFHDVDVTALGYPRGTIPFAERSRWESSSVLRLLALTVARTTGRRVIEGTTASGDRFVADPEEIARIHETFGASCVDMETAAIAMACAYQSTMARHWISIRVISDRADKRAHVDFPTFLPEAAQVLADIVHGLAAQIRT